jgi:hypothetical protein
MPDELDPGALRPEVRWGVGCLVAAVSMIGVLILVFFIAFVGEFAQWVQILLGIGLALGGAALAWLISSSLAHRSERELKVTPPPTGGEDLPER